MTCGKYVAGCGAVAVAQLMRYWRWPDNALINAKRRHFDWNNMPLEIYNHTPIYQVDAVANLLHECAAAIVTSYFTEGSSAPITQIVPALQTTFNYHAKYFTAYTSKEITPVLIAEIDAKRPVLCQAFKNHIGEGHTFIIDGYGLFEKEDGAQEIMLHINWGWGWKTTDLTEGSMDYLAYYNLHFMGYCNTRTFVTEIYPKCSARKGDLVISDEVSIGANEVRNHYSQNNIYTTNTFQIHREGHLILEAGNSIRLLPGFHAKAGSDVELSIRPYCQDVPDYLAPRHISPPENMEDEHEQPFRPIFNQEHTTLPNTPILYYQVYDLSGYLLTTSPNPPLDLSSFPARVYIVVSVAQDNTYSIRKVVK